MATMGTRPDLMILNIHCFCRVEEFPSLRNTIVSITNGLADALGEGKERPGETPEPVSKQQLLSCAPTLVPTQKAHNRRART